MVLAENDLQRFREAFHVGEEVRMRDDGRWWEGIVTSTSPLEVRTRHGPPSQGRAMGRVWKQVEKKTVQEDCLQDLAFVLLAKNELQMLLKDERLQHLGRTLLERREANPQAHRFLYFCIWLAIAIAIAIYYGLDLISEQRSIGLQVSNATSSAAVPSPAASRLCGGSDVNDISEML